MTMRNARPSSFNPSALQPAGQPSTVPLGASNPESQEYIRQTPMTGPDGRHYIQQQVIGTDGQPRGAASFISKNPDGTTQSYQPGANGQWVEGEFHKRNFGEAVFGDEKLMTFLAVAAGGAALSGAYGAGGAGGSMLGSGTGATPGVVAGGTMGTEGLAGAGAAGGMFSGAGQAAGNAAQSPYDTEGLDKLIAERTGNPNMNSGMLSQLFGDKAGDIIGGLLGTGANAWMGNQEQQKLNQAADKARQEITAAGQQAADLSKFTPFNVSGGLAGASFNGTNVTQTLDPRMKAIQDQALAGAGGFLGSVNAGTPDQLAQQAYANYAKWAKPQQEQQFSGLQDRLARQGLLGLNVNTGSVAGSGNTSVNPYYKDFAEGVATADLKNYENSVLFGQKATGNQIGLGQGMLGMGMDIDAMGREAINTGRQLGDSQSRAGAIAGGFLSGAARDSANVGFNRANDEAGADAARNRALWDSVFNNLF